MVSCSLHKEINGDGDGDGDDGDDDEVICRPLQAIYFLDRTFNN